MKSSKEKVKTTVMIDKTLKKFAQVFAIQHDSNLGEVIEAALREYLGK
jgi:hypothetical protein